jgi:hypothetical protein
MPSCEFIGSRPFTEAYQCLWLKILQPNAAAQPRLEAGAQRTL